ncbi:MAG: hypothetical protein K0A94_05880 [Desulfuromonadales bacterium]|nr:hypothetical protein [Desulfuromonadales bacterium]
MDSRSEVTWNELHTGLRKIRVRRWFLWLLVLAYVPLMMVALRAQDTKQVVAVSFVVWLLLLIVAVAMMALARCPVCGYCFHMSGYLFRPVRRCFECGLHLTADKQALKEQAGSSTKASGPGEGGIK